MQAVRAPAPDGNAAYAAIVNSSIFVPSNWTTPALPSKPVTNVAPLFVRPRPFPLVSVPSPASNRYSANKLSNNAWCDNCTRARRARQNISTARLLFIVEISAPPCARYWYLVSESWSRNFLTPQLDQSKSQLLKLTSRWDYLIKSKILSRLCYSDCCILY